MNEQIINFMRALVPALKSVPNETINVWIDLAKLFVCDGRFGEDGYKAIALYALHLMLADGALKGESEGLDSYSQRMASYSLSGEFSITYASGSGASSSTLRSTPWGNMYLNLLRKKGGGFGLVTSAGRGCGCR